MQTVFVAALEFTLKSLEAAVEKDPSVAAPNDDDFFAQSSSSSSSSVPGSNNNVSKEEQHRKTLAAAYEFMGLAQGSTTEEQLKKRYKQLSLKYHPDRNGGSQESQANQQKLNACVDLIEKDLLGVTEEDEQNHEEHASSSHHDGDEDESPMERYRRMREEMQKEMEAELARQQKALDDFEASKETMKQESAKRTKELGLDTMEGRQQAYDRFVKDVAARKQTDDDSHPKDSSAHKPTNSKSMNDIDDDDGPKDNLSTSKKSPKESAKPKYNLMEYGETEDEVILALRMGPSMPGEVVMEFLQKQLQEYFQEEARNMHFEGIKKTPRECRLGFLLQARDDDMNTILHYAAYFESLQVIQSLCQVALKDRQLAPVLANTNLYGQTATSLAESANDNRVLVLLQSQEQLCDHIQKHTQILPALRAVPSRISDMIKKAGPSTIISSMLSFTILYLLCGLYLVTSVVALMLVQTVARATAKNVVNRYANHVGMLWSFCGLWILSRVIVNWILEVVMVELLLLLAPVVVAGVVSSKNRRRSGGVLGLLLLPLEAHAGVSEKIEPIFSKVFSLLTPKFLKGKYPAWILPYYLSLSAIAFYGVAKTLDDAFGPKEFEFSYD